MNRIKSSINGLHTNEKKSIEKIDYRKHIILILAEKICLGIQQRNI